MAPKKQPPKSPPQSPDDLVQQIHEAEKPLRIMADKINAKNKEVADWREANPKLGELEEEAVQLFAEFRDLQQPVTSLLGQLSQMDPARFGQELRRISEAGLNNG